MENMELLKAMQEMMDPYQEDVLAKMDAIQGKMDTNYEKIMA
jgi:hypothetical protein